jgi:hypothetical protein
MPPFGAIRPAALGLALAKARAKKPKATNGGIHRTAEGGQRSCLGFASERPGIVGPPALDAGTGTQLGDDVVHIHDIAGMPT